MFWVFLQTALIYCFQRPTIKHFYNLFTHVYFTQIYNSCRPRVIAQSLILWKKFFDSIFIDVNLSCKGRIEQLLLQLVVTDICSYNFVRIASASIFFFISVKFLHVKNLIWACLSRVKFFVERFIFFLRCFFIEFYNLNFEVKFADFLAVYFLLDGSGDMIMCLCLRLRMWLY